MPSKNTEECCNISTTLENQEADYKTTKNYQNERLKTPTPPETGQNTSPTDSFASNYRIKRRYSSNITMLHLWVNLFCRLSDDESTCDTLPLLKKARTVLIDYLNKEPSLDNYHDAKVTIDKNRSP